MRLYTKSLIMPNLVSIIIANNSKNPRSKEFLSRCFASIKKNTHIPYEIIVKDGASIGPAKARNLAAKKARGKYLLFLDYDTEVSKSWLKNTIQYLDKHPKIGGGQLKLLRLDRKTIFDSTGDKLTPFGFLAERAQEAEDKGQFDKVKPIFSGKGAAMIVRKDVFEEISGFDKDYFMYWEEPDLCWRIWKLRYRVVFLPMGKVWHAYGTKKKKVETKWDIQITYLGCRNHIATIIKNCVGLSGIIMLVSVASAWVGLFFLFLIKFNFRKALSVLKALFWIVKNLKIILQKRADLIERLGDKFYSDSKWMFKIKDNRGVNWYLGKGISYILGRPY